MLVLLGALHWLAVMQIVKSMLQAQIHGALGTLKILNISQFSPASLGLAMGCPVTLPLHCLMPAQILLELTLARLDVLVPQVRRRDALRG